MQRFLVCNRATGQRYPPMISRTPMHISLDRTTACVGGLPFCPLPQSNYERQDRQLSQIRKTVRTISTVGLLTTFCSMTAAPCKRKRRIHYERRASK